MSNFTFGHIVFKSRLLLLRQNVSVGGKGVIYYKISVHDFKIELFRVRLVQLNLN